MFRSTLKRPLMAVAATSVLALGVSAAPASAATQQDGLVNVSLTDTTVQVPVGVAANICNVNANVIATGAFDGNDRCDSASRSSARDRGGNGGSTRQEGLVNVAVTDTTIQVPVGIAANVCNVNANVIAANTFDGNDRCDSATRSIAAG